MPRNAKETDLTAHFGKQYARSQTNVILAIERAVCGCDYGGNSWTTRREAEQVGRLLNLGPEVALLDVGAGSGWPALYIARNTGCDLTMMDVPLAGIRIAAARAKKDGLTGGSFAAVGDGGLMPFKDGSFDAISHSDVLCCLESKGHVLRECRRVIRPGGVMAFTVILILPGLSPERVAAAVDFGPPFIFAEREYPDMLAAAGWRLTERIDLTAEYALSTIRFLDAWKENTDQVIAVTGADEYHDVLKRKTGCLRLVEQGDIRRQLFAVAA